MTEIVDHFHDRYVAKQNMERKMKISTCTFLGLLFILCTCLFLFYRFRKKQKKNKLYVRKMI